MYPYSPVQNQVFIRILPRAILDATISLFETKKWSTFSLGSLQSFCQLKVTLHVGYRGIVNKESDGAEGEYIPHKILNTQYQFLPSQIIDGTP